MRALEFFTLNRAEKQSRFGLRPQLVSALVLLSLSFSLLEGPRIFRASIVLRNVPRVGNENGVKLRAATSGEIEREGGNIRIFEYAFVENPFW